MYPSSPCTEADIEPATRRSARTVRPAGWRRTWGTARRRLAACAAAPSWRAAPTTPTLTVRTVDAAAGERRDASQFDSGRGFEGDRTQAQFRKLETVSGAASCTHVYKESSTTAHIQTCICAAGVCFYQRESLPGYSAIFKHPNEELNFCYCAPLASCTSITLPVPLPILLRK